jgi:hypothetical protein
MLYVKVLSIYLDYKKGCSRLAATSDKVYQLLVDGQWFSLGTPASSTTKTSRHDIAEILLKVALKHNKSIKFRVQGTCNYPLKYNFSILKKLTDEKKKQ